MSYYGLCGSDMTAFNSKAGAMSFAIQMSSFIGENGMKKVDYDEAEKLYSFITEHVDLPNVERDSYAEMMSAVTGLAKVNATGTALCKE